MTMPEFRSFASIPRLFRPAIVTEKIDGTNAVVDISDHLWEVTAGSRSRWITPEDDNFGFAAWVRDHAEELRQLGPGRHYGEWWGEKIQRGYGLSEKRWSLFNVSRWGPGGTDEAARPACCHVVPILARLEVFDLEAMRRIGETLRATGSQAAPGFMEPEGLVVCHEPSGALFKYTLDGDGHKHERDRGRARLLDRRPSIE